MKQFENVFPPKRTRRASSLRGSLIVGVEFSPSEVDLGHITVIIELV